MGSHAGDASAGQAAEQAALAIGAGLTGVRGLAALGVGGGSAALLVLVLLVVVILGLASVRAAVLLLLLVRRGAIGRCVAVVGVGTAAAVVRLLGMTVAGRGWTAAISVLWRLSVWGPAVGRRRRAVAVLGRGLVAAVLRGAAVGALGVRRVRGRSAVGGVGGWVGALERGVSIGGVDMAS